MSVKKDKEGQLLDKVLRQKGGLNPVIDTFNNFITYGIQKVFKSSIVRITDTKIAKFENPVFAYPTIADLTNDTNGGKERPLYPAEARQKRLSYMAKLMATIKIYKLTDNKWVEENDTETVMLGKIPALIGSQIDRTTELPDWERVKHGEPVGDKGGYFIIKGGEKILLNIEKLRTSTPLLYNDNGEYVVRYTAHTLLGDSLIIVKENPKVSEQEYGNIHVTFTNIGNKEKGINVFNMFALLGLKGDLIESALKLMDQFIIDGDKVRLERRRKELRYRLQSTIHRYISMYSKNKETIYNQVKLMYTNKTIADSTDENSLVNAIRVDLFPNIPMGTTDNQRKNALGGKIRLLASMVVKLVEFKNGYRKLDDRDSWGNKRLVDVGETLTSRFVVIWREIMNDLTNSIKGRTITTAKIIKSKIQARYMTDNFIHSFGKEIWGGGKNNRNVVILDTLKRDTRVAWLIHPRRITTPTNRRAKIREKRLIHGSQLGLICPTSTPDGEACGLVKEPSQTEYTSLDRDETFIDEKINKNYVIWATEEYKNPVYLNGINIGFCKGEELKNILIKMRRTNQIYFDTEIKYDEYGELWISCNAGRPTQPLLIVNPETQKLVIDEKNLRNVSLKEIMGNGCLEYIDASEQAQPYIYIAETVRKLSDRMEKIEEYKREYEEILADTSKTKNEIEVAKIEYENAEKRIKYTHCFIDPAAILGVSASTIPLPEFMPGPRSTYQANMSKQALGPNAFRIDLRFDTTVKTLVAPSVPTFVTEAHDTLGLDMYPAGLQTTIAILTYGGDNQEDAITINKNALGRGAFALMIYHAYEATESNKTAKSKEYIRKLTAVEAQNPIYDKIDPETGIVKLGVNIKRGEVIIAKSIYNDTTKEIKNANILGEIGKEGTVDEIFETKNMEGARLIRIRVREYRELQVGDKLASRYSQKGTIGSILPEEDMPFVSEGNVHVRGTIPSVLFNPHGIPSRMTIGKLIEILTGNAAAVSGDRINATAFRRFRDPIGPNDYNPERVNLDILTDQLTKLGFQDNGKVTMTNGKTGMPIEAEVFMGPVYYQVLKHLVQDKMQARTIGPVQLLTRQPISGIRNRGGLRLGEMERDALIAHGAMYLLQERLMYSSDPYTAIVCRPCGLPAVSDIDRSTIYCNKCNNREFIRTVYPYGTKLLFELANGCNVKITLVTKEI